MSAPALARSWALHAALIALLGAAIYANSISVPFQFDDAYYITDNPAIKDPDFFLKNPVPENTIMNMVKSAYHVRRVGFLTFRMNYLLGGMKARGFHLVNVAIHIVNSLLLYWLVTLTLRTPVLEGSALKERARPLALLCALLFVAHPIQSQAVTYITQRFASLVTLFCLLSLALYARARLSERPSATYALYAISLASAVLAMKTKENAFTLPLAISAYEFLFFRGGTRGRVLRLLPFIATTAIVPLSLINFEAPLGDAVAGATRTQLEISRPEYLATELRVIVTYLRLLLLPVNQALDYDYPVMGSFLKPEVLASLLLLCGLLLFLLRERPRAGKDPGRAMVLFGGIWFFLMLSVESSVIPLADVIFEHRVYLPSAGLFMAVSTLAFSSPGRWRARPFLTAAAAALLVALLSAAAIQRNTAWRSEAALWEDNLRKAPSKFRVAANLGAGYLKDGRPAEAAAFLEDVLKRMPASKAQRADVYSVLGTAYLKLGRKEEALERFTTAVGLDSRHSGTYSNMASLYGQMGDYEEAFEASSKAVELDAFNKTALNNLGLSLASMGRYGDAVPVYGRALAIDPDYDEARYNLGLAYLTLGDSQAALAQWDALKGLNPSLAGDLLLEISRAPRE